MNILKDNEINKLVKTILNDDTLTARQYDDFLTLITLIHLKSK